MKSNFTNKRGMLIKVFILSLITSGAAIITATILNGGTFQLGTDYFDQQIPFAIYCSQAIRDGNILWSDAVDLGTSFINAFGYYNIGSPFFWFAMLFKPQHIPLMMTMLLVIKTALAGTFATLYLSRYTKKADSAIIGGLLFAFSSYLINNVIFHFIDSILMFPLLLWALDEEMYKDKKLIFAVVVAFSMLTNYVIFIGEIVFLAMYFLVKLMSKEYTLTLPKFFNLSIESILGVGAASVIILPSALALLNNPRLGLTFGGIQQMLLLKPIQFAELIKSMLLPVDTMFRSAFYIEVNPTAPDFYVPVFGCILAFSYILQNRKSWLSKLLVLCGVFALVPILNSSFMLFNAEYYPRWLYMPLMVFILATVLELENVNISLKKGFIAWSVLVGIFIFNAFYWIKNYGTDLFEVGNLVAIIQNSGLALFLIVFGLSGVGFCLVLRFLQRNLKYADFIIIAAVMAFSFISTVYSYNNLHIVSKSNNQSAKDFYSVGAKLDLPTDEYYRIDTLDTYLNLGVVSGHSSVNFFTTTISGSIFDFYEKGLDIQRTVRSNVSHDNFALRALLSCKYYVATSQASTPPYSELFKTVGNFKIYENEYFVPMGYPLKNIISQTEFEKITKEDKPFALINALVLKDEDIEELNINHLGSEKITEQLSLESFERDIQANKNNSCQSFEKTKMGYKAQISLEDNELLFFSIPYDEGWSAFINGNPVDIYLADYGFMALQCKTGENVIEFKYFPKGLKIGIVLTVISSALLVAYGLYYYKKKTNKYY